MMKGVVDMAIMSAELTYDYHFDELIRCAENGDTEAVSKKKQYLKDEIKKSIRSEMQQAFGDMLRALYDNDSTKLKSDIAKIALVGNKGLDNNIDRTVLLSFLWNYASSYYKNNPKQLKYVLNCPERGLYLGELGK